MPNGRGNGNGNGRSRRKTNGNGNGNASNRGNRTNGNRRPNGAGNRRAGTMARRNGGARSLDPMTMAPIMNVNGNYRPLRQGITTLSGSDFFAPLVVQAAPTTTERILLEIPVSPSFYPGTRLTQISQLWERYRFTSFRLRYVPAVPTTLACQLVLYIDTDPSDDPNTAITSETLVRQATAQTGAQQWNFNVPKVTPLAIRCDDQFYYTGDTKQNERFNLQGRAYVIQVTDPLNFNGDALTDATIAGSIYIDWTCQFQIPQINPAGFGLRSTKVLGPTIPSGTDISNTPTPYVVPTGLLKPNKTYLFFWIAPGTNPLLVSAGSTNALVRLYQPTSLREGLTRGTNRSELALRVQAGLTEKIAVLQEVGTCITDSKSNVTLQIDTSGVDFTTQTDWSIAFVELAS